MAVGKSVTYFLFSSTLVLLLLPLLPRECSELVGDASHIINVNGPNANSIGMSPLFCKTSCSVIRGTLALSLKPFINPLVVTAATLVVCGCVIIGILLMLFGTYQYLKSLILINQNASIAASCCEDDFNDEYGITSRRRIRAQTWRAKSSALSVNSVQLIE